MLYAIKLKLFFFFRGKPLLDGLRNKKFFDEVWDKEYKV
jgi:hypothetical protein